MTRMIFAAAAAVAFTAFTATPAAAQAVGVTGTKPTANARIIKPLALTGVRNLDFGTIVMGTLTANETVTVNGATRTCGTANLTCSGAFQTAQFRVVGTQGQMVTVSSLTPTISLTGSNSGTLTLTPILPANFALDNSGNPGRIFDVGGRFDIGPTTIDGVYSGTLEIQVAYQ